MGGWGGGEGGGAGEGGREREREREVGAGRGRGGGVEAHAWFYLTDTQSYLSPPPIQPAHDFAARQFLTLAWRAARGYS